jgi:hypothetical protein
MNTKIEFRKVYAEFGKVVRGQPHTPWRQVKVKVKHILGEGWCIFAYVGEPDNCLCGSGRTPKVALREATQVLRRLIRGDAQFKQQIHDAVEARRSEYRALGIDPDTLKLMPLIGPIDPLNPEGVEGDWSLGIAKIKPIG